MKKTLIFDLDGTLLNTLEDLRDSTNFALEKFGFPSKTTEEVRNFVGNGLKMLIARALPAGSSDALVEAVLSEMKRHYGANYHNKTRPYPGILPMLEALQREGFRMAIVSNKADSVVQLLRTLYFDRLIPVALGESERCARKPAPDMVFAAVSALGSKLEDCIYVGDSEVDIQTAKNAGMPCASACWGFRSREELLQAGAQSLYQTPADLAQSLCSGGIQ